MSDDMKEFVVEQDTQLEAGVVGPGDPSDVENIEKVLTRAEKKAQAVRDQIKREKNYFLVSELRKLCFSIEMFLRQFEQHTGRKVKDIELVRTSVALDDYTWVSRQSTEPGIANRIDHVGIRLEKQEEAS